MTPLSLSALAIALIGSIPVIAIALIHPRPVEANAHVPIVLASSSAEDPAGLQRMGVRFDTPITAAIVSRDQAIQAAMAWLGPYLTAQASQVSAQFVSFSDDQYADVDAAGQSHPKFQQIPAWVIVFEGMNIPPRGGRRAANLPPHTEMHVVINAETGEYMEAFTYR